MYNRYYQIAVDQSTLPQKFPLLCATVPRESSHTKKYAVKDGRKKKYTDKQRLQAIEKRYI